MQVDVTIRKAIAGESKILTSISFAAKRHWNYPEEHFDRWKDELTISETYIQDNIVYVAVLNNEIVGFYAIVENPRDFWSGEVFVVRGYWLEHIFIKPQYHYKGIGRQLVAYAQKVANGKGITKLLIFVDPFARGFYDKIGAKYLHDSPSSIAGRMIPVYEIIVNSGKIQFIKK